MAVAAAGAQKKFNVLQDISLMYCTPDAHYSYLSMEGVLFIYDNTIDTDDMRQAVYIYGQPDADGYQTDTYIEGYGNASNTHGVIVGSHNDIYPCYWENGVWHDLPIREGDAKRGLYNDAEGITADGSRICGDMGVSGFSLTGDIKTMTVPVYWDRQPDGSYSDYHILPFNERDVTGLIPHYVNALCISDDGKTIAGQVNSGFLTYPIVWREQPDGTWSVERVGLSLVINPDVEIPENPGDGPANVDVLDYMTDSEKAAYDQAVADWNAAYAELMQGLRDDCPDYPMQTDYILDEARKAQFTADKAAYEAAYTEWQAKFQAFQAAMRQATMGRSFNYNTMGLSPNGRYLAISVEKGNAFTGGVTGNPARIDLQTGECILFDKANDGIATTAHNDGTIFYSTPYLAYTRWGYALPAGEYEPVGIVDYIRRSDAAVADQMDRALRFDYLRESIDENGIPEYTEEKDMLMTGTIYSPAPGIVQGYFTNECMEDNWSNVSYTVCLSGTESGINTVKADKGGIQLNPCAAGFEAKGDVKSVVVTDAAGRTLLTVKGEGQVDLRQLPRGGVYIVRATAVDGQTKTLKVTKK